MMAGAKKIPEPITLPTMMVVAEKRPRPRTRPGSAGAAWLTVRTSARMVRATLLPLDPQAVLHSQHAERHAGDHLRLDPLHLARHHAGEGHPAVLHHDVQGRVHLEGVALEHG